MTDPTEGQYKVVLLHGAREQLRGALQAARAMGLVEVKAASVAIHRALSTDPVGWGDPLRELAAAGLTLYHRIHEMFLVRYAVDEQRRIVYIKDCKPLPEHLLDLPES